MDMEVQRPAPRMTAVTHYLLLAACSLFILAARLLRLIVFAVLSTLEPVVRIALSLLAIGGFLTCFLYRIVLHAPHFPTGLMLTFSIAVSMLLVLYSFAMRALSP